MNTNSENLILKTDGYKPSHWKQYPRNTSGLYAFFESRGGDFEETLFFGLQYILMRHFANATVSKEDIEEAREFFSAYYQSNHIFNETGWRYIVEKHGGHIPIRIKAVPEGSIIPSRNALMTIESTDPQVPWIAGYFEPLLSQVWYPSTVATGSRAMRQTIDRFLHETGDPALGGSAYKLHDFGYRGSTSHESAGIGGAAHLINFKGSDTLPGILLARRFYGESMAGNSIPAAEHSTITSWGREREAKAYLNILKEFPKGPVAIVSDSYDIRHACRNIWGETLRKNVLERHGALVIRPDSGDPHIILPELLEILGEKFGSEINSKGYRVLHSKVRLIQGDGITRESVDTILQTIKEHGWSADNISFGSGGGLLQKMDRDTGKFALKCSAIQDENGWHDVLKDPITDPGKRSKAGRLKLIQHERNHTTVRDTAPGKDILETVFENGQLLRTQSFADIRSRALEN